MKISAIVPIYNVECQLLQACLHSVVNQTLRRDEYEIILVDDCSTDGDTIAVITAFTEVASNIKLVRHRENRGLNEARRSGVKAANGDYVVFIDSDDMLTRDAVENLRMKAYETEADVVTAPCFRWISRTKSYAALPGWAKPLPSEYVARLKSVLAGNHSFTMCGRLFKRAILSDDIFDIPLKQLHEDMTTFARILFESQKVAHIRRPIYYYTINEMGATYKFGIGHVDDIFRAFDDWMENAESHGVYEELSGAISDGVGRYVSLMVIRCVLCESPDDDKVKLLNIINEKYRALPVRRPNPSLSGMTLLERLHADSIAGRPTRLQEAIEQTFPADYPAQPNSKTRLKYSLVPTEIARRLKDKVAFICQVDYHLRNAAALARELRLRGHPCAVLDNSAFVASGLRQLPSKENKIFQDTERIQIARPPYNPDWLSTARLVITFNDFNDDFREALEYRHRLGLPTVCIIEGINDFLRVDFQDYRHHLPYRRCDYVFLAGRDDEKYFEDRQTYVVGLPIIESLATKVPTFPDKPFAVLNVNFTYGVLEEAREQFIAKARNAFAAAGYEWVITKHPMDKGGLKGCPVSNLTQYELIDRCSVFVSRFATGILEALAMGKPVIYFNPHNEKAEKFKSPLGAYEIATTEEELIRALKNVANDIEAGVNFRERALPFLKWHTAYQPGGQSVTHRFIDAVTDILERDCEQQSAIADLFFQRLQEQEPFQCEGPGLIVGDFERRHKAQLPEQELIARYFGDSGSIMIDVGAAYGSSLDIYFGKGWTIHAFEPDSNNRQRLLDTWPPCSRLIVNEEAVCDKSGSTVPFFRSDESAGISSLFAFTAGHKQVGEVRTTTLRDYYRKAGLRHADFLKVDVEGFDKFVLDGFPWESDKPEVILVEFEDAKTTPLGYSAHELADTLIRRGYAVYVSEWLPIIRYGITHEWRRLVSYSPTLELGMTWGNMIGFLEDPGEEKLRSLARQTLKFSARPDRDIVYPMRHKRPPLPVQWYHRVLYRLAPYVLRKHPRLAMIYRKMCDKGLLPR